MRTHTFTRATGAAALTLAVSLTAACGSSTDTAAGSSPSSQVSASRHNDADVTFASDMLQHHAQALAMVDLTQGRTLTPEVRRLAEQIRAAQTPEIKKFSTWLEGWGKKVPTTGGTGSMDMGSSSTMPGMMSSTDMKDLENASDSEFQTRWLTMMIKHHEGAVQMARTETDEGRYKPALDVARSISTSQTEEISTMRGLLS